MIATSTGPAKAEPETARKVDPNTPWVASTYFAEGLPYSLVHKVSAEYLVNAHASAQIVGLANLAHLPWNFKFLWAPLVDRYGTTKKWMVGVQLAIAAAVLFLAAFAATFVPWAFAVGVILLALFATTNDTAIDGYYIRRLDKARQGSLTGVRVGAYRVALMVGGLIVTLGGLAGFGVAFSVAALLMAAFAVVHAFVLERDSDGVAHRPLSSIARFAAKSFFAKPRIVRLMVLLVTYKAGDQLLFSMNSKFLASLGLDTATRGLVSGTFGTLASIAGTVAGAWILARRGLPRTFTAITAWQAAAILFYVELAVLRPSFPSICAVILIEQFVAGIGTAAFSVFMMRICEGEQKATQFAFASSVMTLSMTLAGAASGFVYASLGPAIFFLIAFLASVPGVVLSGMLDPRLLAANAPAKEATVR